MGGASQRRRERRESKSNAMAAIAHAEAYSKLKVDYDILLKENQCLRDEICENMGGASQRRREQRESKSNAMAATAHAEAYSKLKVDYDILLKEYQCLRDEVESDKKMLVDETGKVGLKPKDVFDPQYTAIFYPHLCPRFPERRESLPIDAGLDQTPVLKRILRNYKISSPKMCFPDSGLVSPTVAPSVVAVSSFFGLERKFDCSGLVIHWSSSEKEATILTSAKLLWNPEDSDFEFHIIVRMADGTLLLAREEHVDYYHNLLTLKVNSSVEVEVVDLRCRQADIVDGMKVTSLGRDINNSVLLDVTGELSEARSRFGCDELLSSSCVISESAEGGPLVTDEGYVAGINFFGGYKGAHPLPTPTILSCLEMWKSSSTVVRPWFGIRVIDLYEICKELSIPFEKKIVSDRELYIFVDEVYEGSVAHRNNVSPCDAVYALNGTPLECFKQYSQMLSDASRAATAGDSGHPLRALIIPDDCPTNEKTIEAEYIPVDDKRFSICWPQVDVDGWLRRTGGLENPGVLCWPPEEDDKC